MADFSLENRCGAFAGTVVAGIDEVGRGALAGPVVVAAAAFRRCRLGGLRSGIRDSKVLTARQRQRVAAALGEFADVGIGTATVAEIVALNSLRASMLAMRRAIEALPREPAVPLIDGNEAPLAAETVHLVPHGDAKCLSIAAASIVAKLTRDRMMDELALRYSGYGWERNHGYATAEHLAALARVGASPEHRRNFRRVLPAATAFQHVGV